jgi:hypothetical protein
MAIDVFLSVGRTSTDKQEAFVAEIERHLRDNGLEPRGVGRNEFTSQQPLKFIESLMCRCSGTVIIAFERLYIQEGLDRRGSPEEEVLTNTRLPTVWNQVEAAMAYVLGHPLLVIVENGLRSEGLLETGYDWYLLWVNLDSAITNKKEFSGVFADWSKRVEDYHKTGKRPSGKVGASIEPEKITIGELVGLIKPAQLWAMGSGLIAALSGLAAAAYKAGAVHLLGK